MNKPSPTALPVDARAPFFIVLNVGSGHDDAAQVRQTIERVLTDGGREFVLRTLDDPSQLRRIAVETVEQARARGGVVVAAGGDGTLNTMAQATLGSGCPFGVLPQGTFNYFSRTHGIPSDPAESTRVLLTARAHPVQVGLVNDKVFLVNASLGLYPQLLEDREAYKHRFGRRRLVALFAGLMTLLREPRQLRLQIEHRGETREMRTPTLFVGNNRLQFEQIGIAEAPLLERDLLVALALKPVSTMAMLGLLCRGAMGKLGEAESVIDFAFKRITVQPSLPYGARRIKVATDGEISWMKTPLEFRVAPEHLYLLKPEPQDDVGA